ncbi:glutamate/gamma-aminobutyrate family transporter YjeM [Clostridium autoethanogenum]|uniref:Inner membrane transporter YjeM n=2 Tax=Clostridium TaxID=1485 RepID=D8GU43_CLOLD|nr:MULTISPECIES: glutamate/gamma-aminobutyrate family transporter YjeM [Clostridium]ADK14706.1 predicted amino acid permease [Clostridium ljungdahlii DSM 13528]OAA85943.1 Inner membrane transporter YjeM [Clostridium ljungdahlii DSM 13528]RMC99972.1 glutamate/gamma-aminobutyrate family transporter YjeM [Clostridium autoethanogenum]
MGTNNLKKLSLVALILMIFTEVFGFANMPRAFLLMGYSSIPWYIISGIAFFIPYAFMMAEFGSAFKDEKGGIYSWMNRSVGPKYAFEATFMWYASYVVLIVDMCSLIWIPLSNLIFGKDVTASWGFWGLKSTQVIGIFSIIFIVAITFIATKGLKDISKVTSIGGTAVMLLNVFLIIGAVIVLIASHGHLAQPLSFTVSPNPKYGSSLSILSFIVFAIFAYGGIEVVAGLVDQTEKPEKNFAKGMAISAIVITLGYSIGIFMCGIFTNWKQVLSNPDVHLANVAYVIMQNLGYQLGVSFNLSQSAALTLGAWIARFVGLSMFLALTGSIITVLYGPLKQIIEGTPKGLFPEKLTAIKDDMPKNAMWAQCIIIVLFLVLLTIGGEGASKFFNIVVSMTNVALTIPYMFIAGAFVPFKKKKEINKPFIIFKGYKSSLIWEIVVVFTIGFANLFTIIAPAFQGDMQSTIWMVVGPIFFSIVAFILYSNYEKKNKFSKQKVES